MATKQEVKFPLYLMSIDGKRKFMSMREAGVACDSSFCRVEVCRLVLNDDFSVRDITREEEAEMSKIADQHSESK